MAVGDNGKIISIRWFKGVVFAGALLLLSAVLAAGGLYYLYRQGHRMNRQQAESLLRIRAQVVALKNEKDILTARLVMTESELKRLLHAGSESRTDEAAPVLSETLPNGEETPVAAAAGETNGNPAEAASGKPEAENMPASVSADGVASEVGVEELKVTYEADSQTFRAQFKLKHIGSGSEPISGYTAVVLSNRTLSPDNWLTLPTIKLAAGKPAGHRRGQYFSISRFKTVKFITINASDPEQYDTATVFVFDAAKNPLFEKSFPVRVETISSAGNRS